jgi:hypothetical protein
MQNKFFGSKLNTVLLFVLIIILGVVIWLIKENKILSQLGISKQEVQNTQTEMKGDIKNENTLTEYKNDKLGFSFSYPSSWGLPKENIRTIKEGVIVPSFEYDINFESSGVDISGLSYPYDSPGRGGWYVDFTEASISGEACDPHTNEVVKNKDGISGVYTLALFVPGLGDCEDYETQHYAVFDVNKKVTNIVFVGDSNKITKDDFLKIVQSVSLE